MTLKNLNQNTTLTTDLKICTSLSDLSFGLLNPKNPRSLLFKTRFGLHTFGLKGPIDVLVLQPLRHADPESSSGFSASAQILKQVRDDEVSESRLFEVMMLKRNLKPNRLFFWDPKYDRVVELPDGTIKSSQTKINNQLELT